MIHPPQGRHILINPARDKAFVLTLKAGSSTMSTTLEHDNGWERFPEAKLPFPPSVEVFGLIRHPFDRWVSGVAQVWTPWFDPPTKPIDKLVEYAIRTGDITWFLHHGSEDQHQYPQWWNFKVFPDAHLVRFSELPSIFPMLGIAQHNGHHIRDHRKMGYQGEMRRVIEHRAFPHRRSIEEVYLKDLDLWERASS